MKKLLLCSAAVALGLSLAAPASAAGIKLDAGGHFKGYLVWGSQDNLTDGGGDDRGVDILRETELRFTGETTLDNGLTVGVYHDFNIDSSVQVNSDDNVGTVQTRESYAYFSGAWGRVNFGKEDGAAYLLQVAAPSADSNVDGLRQYINPVNYALTDATTFTHSGINLETWLNTFGIDYSNDITGYHNKATYLTPVFSGFQFGVSYTPDVNNFGNDQNGLQGVHHSNADDEFGTAWEGSGRYEGKFQNLDITFGAGYSHVGLEQDDDDGVDDFVQWNVGGNVAWSAFNFGVGYLTDNGGADDNSDNETWNAGVDYTTGPYKLGFSYLSNNMDLGDDAGDPVPNSTMDTHRYTGGVVYTYGPGMTFRGSVSYVSSDMPTVGMSNIAATDVLLGTQINF